MPYEFSILSELLQAFYKLTAIRIAVFNLNFDSVFGYPEEVCEFCAAIRSCPAYLSDCMRCDREATEKCKRADKPYTYTCHCGLTESIFPITFDNEIFGYIMLGQVLTDPKNVDIQKLQRFFSQKECRRLIACVPQKSLEEIAAAVIIMEALGSYDVIRQLMRENRDILVERFKRYVAEHLGEDLSVAAVCSALKISRSYLYQCVTPKINCTIRQYIGEMRNKKAAALLENSNYSITKISELCGYADYNYFSRVYKKRNGISPVQFRKRFL